MSHTTVTALHNSIKQTGKLASWIVSLHLRNLQLFSITAVTNFKTNYL